MGCNSLVLTMKIYRDCCGTDCGILNCICTCHHTTTQKKECVCSGKHEGKCSSQRAGADHDVAIVGKTESSHTISSHGSRSLPTTPSINEIIKEFPNPQDYSDRDGIVDDAALEDFRKDLRNTLTSYRASIYKELIDAIEGAEKDYKDTSFCDDEADRQNFNAGLKIAAQIIKQKQEGS